MPISERIVCESNMIFPIYKSTKNILDDFGTRVKIGDRYEIVTFYLFTFFVVLTKLSTFRPQ
jgi:hypothetical protein